MKNNKKIMSAIILLFVVLTMVVSTISTAAKVTMYGDANEDGKVTISDVTEIQQYLVHMMELSPQGVENALVSDNEELSIADATIIQQYLAHIIDRLPLKDEWSPIYKP